MKQELSIGFIGQGWIGKNYADDFERLQITNHLQIYKYSIKELLLI